MLWRYRHLTAAGSFSVAPSEASFLTLNINTAAASSTVTVYNGTSSSGDVVAVIDSSTARSYGYGVYCDDGIFVVIAGGNPDVTIGYR